MGETLVSKEMKEIVGKIMRKSISFPITSSDIRKWAIAVYYPKVPPRIYWDEEYASNTIFGGIVAPEEFNPFAWATQTPSLKDPRISQTAFSELELGVNPPKYSAFILTEIKTSYGNKRMFPGDVIKSEHKISDYFERKGARGHMLYTTIKNIFKNQNDEFIKSVDSVFVRY